MRLAVIGTFHKRYECSLPILRRLYVEGSRTPDEAWLLGEDNRDAAALDDARRHLGLGWPEGLVIEVVPTPVKAGGKYEVIPYSHKINHALDRTTADLIVYLDNGSLPHERKYELMAGALEEHPDWPAVYCGQLRTGYRIEEHHAQDVIPDGYCQLNYTQVMHRRTPVRWTLDPQYGNPDLADGMFWRDLHEQGAAYHPVAPGQILDEHEMHDHAVEGLR